MTPPLAPSGGGDLGRGSVSKVKDSHHFHFNRRLVLKFLLNMQLSSPVPHKRARIEIIPLIDIMFFLLASFMMVSLSQTHMKGIRVNLPWWPWGLRPTWPSRISLP